MQEVPRPRVSRILTRRRTLLISAASLLLVAGNVPAASSAEPDEDHRDNHGPEVDDLMEEFGHSLGEAQHVLERQAVRYEIAEALAEALDDRLVGLWVDHGQERDLKVGVVDDGAEVQAQVEAVFEGDSEFAPYQDDVALVSQEHESETLMEAYDLASERLPQIEEELRTQATLAYRPSDNIIRLGVDSPDARAQRVVEDVLGSWSRHFVLEEREPEAESCSREDCTGHDLRGGLASEPGCTLGFSASNGSNRRYMMSAGHCFDQGDWVGHSGTTVGGVPNAGNASVNGPRVDAARIDIGAAWGQTNTPHIYDSPTTRYISVDRVMSSTMVRESWCDEPGNRVASRQVPYRTH
ncbi:hypothetical protein ER308_11580 [Egibacter rhizosphaerae]|uniref:Uncharacterized protein n=1 Tax=Egibacter rhizosphaerae TaxID=1670831 RepID=A0A411YFY4_9ACTN|nr:hypothetical protein [Egibacter rhizosphaerae]QBI20140.1 hypothetical protein ER308_11580 [Egibacter rhizosphaerae]